MLGWIQKSIEGVLMIKDYHEGDRVEISNYKRLLNERMV